MTKSVAPDQTLRSAASDLGLHYLLRPVCPIPGNSPENTIIYHLLYPAWIMKYLILQLIEPFPESYRMDATYHVKRALIIYVSSEGQYNISQHCHIIFHYLFTLSADTLQLT